MKDHTRKRCDACEFWEEALPLKDIADPDDRSGSCHRNAPRPSMGWFEPEVLKFLSTLAWQEANDEEQESDFNNWQRAHLEECIWPRTFGDGWCGEWRKAEPAT